MTDVYTGPGDRITDAERSARDDDLRADKERRDAYEGKHGLCDGIGDRIAEADALAARDDARQSAAKNDRRMPTTFEALGDSLLRFTTSQVGGRGLRDAPVAAKLQFDMAVDRLRERAESHRYRPAVIQQFEKLAYADTVRAWSMCESPIEKIMAPWLICQDYGAFNSWPPRVHLPKEDDAHPGSIITIVPQFAFVKFRVDFGIVGRLEGKTLIVALECDGGSFHTDKLKDEKRDAYLAAWGIETVRASGSEIHQNPPAVAKRVAFKFQQLGAELTGRVS